MSFRDAPATQRSNPTATAPLFVLTPYTRRVKFTAVAFESSYGMLDDAGSSKIVFVGCDKGTVLQISYRTRNVICVLKLHDGPVNCLQVNEGYAVTGGGDGFLRLWPLDFSDYLLEAKHESGVTAGEAGSSSTALAPPISPFPSLTLALPVQSRCPWTG